MPDCPNSGYPANQHSPARLFSVCHRVAEEKRTYHSNPRPERIVRSLTSYMYEHRGVTVARGPEEVGWWFRHARATPGSERSATKMRENRGLGVEIRRDAGG